MLTHIVCFKYKSDAPQAARDDHRKRLGGLHGIDGIVSLTVGADVVHSPRSYDTALVVVFRDRAALDAYQTNPQHVPVAQFGVSLCEHIVAVDFTS
jgi:stress responsive alpha/beta barrel protein